MAVLAQYSSGNENYARSANAFLSGAETGQSLMERKQAMSLRQQQADQQKEEFTAKLPVLVATGQADIVSAHASIENATLMEQFRAKAASESKDLNQAYLNAIQMPSFEDQAKALSALQPRVAYMETLPEYKGFVTAVNNATVRAHGSALADRQLNNKLDQIDLRSQYQSEMARQKADLMATQQAERESHAKELTQAKFDLQQAKLDQTGATAYNKERGTDMAKQVAEVQSRVPQHYAVLDQTSRARALIDQDAEQGRGRSTVVGVEQAINSFLPGTFDTTKEEALKNSYAEMALAAAAKMKGQGSITEAERSLLAESTAKFGNSPQAAKYIMDFMDAVAKREIKRADYYSELEDDGQMVTGKRTTDFYRQNPITKFLTSSIPQNETQINSPSGPLVIKSIRRID